MAGRKGFVRYFQSRKGYFTTYLGKRYQLALGPDDGPNGPTFLAALEAFKKVIADAGAVLAGDDNRVSTVIARYLEWIKSRRKERTYLIRKGYLEAFCQFSDQGSIPYGDIRVRHLLPHHIERYCDFMKSPRWLSRQHRSTKWTSGSVRAFIDSVQSAFNWAAGPKQRLITVNPVKGIENPGPRSRGAEYLATPEMHRKALAVAGKDLQELLIVCENTGCRPGELFMAEARHFDPSLGALIFRSQAHLQEGENGHKTSNKGKDRIIMLTGDALQLTKELVAKHPSGPLFRTGRHPGCKGGQSWTTQLTCHRMKRLRRKAGLPKTFTLYSYRHARITNWLKAGMSIDDLAALMGNTPAVIRKSYSHVADDLEHLRNVAHRFHGAALPPAAAINEAT